MCVAVGIVGGAIYVPPCPRRYDVGNRDHPVHGPPLVFGPLARAVEHEAPEPQELPLCLRHVVEVNLAQGKLFPVVIAVVELGPTALRLGDAALVAVLKRAHFLETKLTPIIGNGLMDLGEAFLVDVLGLLAHVVAWVFRVTFLAVHSPFTEA